MDKPSQTETAVVNTFSRQHNSLMYYWKEPETFVFTPDTGGEELDDVIKPVGKYTICF